MRLTPRKHLSGFLLAIVALIFAAFSGGLYAQSTSRSFQMALWTSPNNSLPTVKTDVDIASFYEGENQPEGLSILLNLNWQQSAPLAGRYPYDWSRIIAVEVDEPYRQAMGTANPCIAKNMGPSTPPYTQNTFYWYESILADKAAQVKALAPKARFWVNYSKEEMDWAANGTSCFVPLNYNYIDVISMDDYGADFNGVVSPIYYTYLISNASMGAPGQQIALLPPTFLQHGSGNPSDAARELQEYLDYANKKNQNCTLALGPRGVTGIYDRCQVWIVMGYLAGDDPAGNAGLLDPRVKGDQLDLAWHQELVLPLRPALARQLRPGQILQMILPQLSDN